MRVSNYVNNGMFVNLFTVMSTYKTNVKLTVTGQHVNINVQRVSLRLWNMHYLCTVYRYYWAP